MYENRNCIQFNIWKEPWILGLTEHRIPIDSTEII